MQRRRRVRDRRAAVERGGSLPHRRRRRRGCRCATVLPVPGRRPTSVCRPSTSRVRRRSGTSSSRHVRPACSTICLPAEFTGQLVRSGDEMAYWQYFPAIARIIEIVRESAGALPNAGRSAPNRARWPHRQPGRSIRPRRPRRRRSPHLLRGGRPGHPAAPAAHGRVPRRAVPPPVRDARDHRSLPPHRLRPPVPRQVGAADVGRLVDQPYG